MKSISMNIMRIALLLVFLGIFLPLGCKSNGFEIAQGILGNADMGKGAMFLESVNDFFGYLLFAVFIIAAVGFVVSLISNINNNFTIAFICLAVSFVFMVIILLKLQIYFNFNEFSFYVKGVIPVKISLLAGGYLMIIGYIGGALIFVLNKMNVLE